MTPLQCWIVLGIAIVSEVCATTSMKLSDGLTRWPWVVAMVVGYLVALAGLALALRQIEVGIAYAVWAGAGILLVAGIGILWFGESVSPLKIASMALVVAGVAGLHLADRLGRAAA